MTSETVHFLFDIVLASAIDSEMWTYALLIKGLIILGVSVRID